MKIDVRERGVSVIPQYATVPIAFDVTSVLDIEQDKDGQFALKERRLDHPYVKNYDTIDGEGPRHWPRRFDISNWGIFTAPLNGQHVGGAAVAFKTPGFMMLDQHDDIAVLWDIRVSPKPAGGELVPHSSAQPKIGAKDRGCRYLKIETQNINVAACRFYAAQGCELRAANRHAYPEFPDEIQLIWYKTLGKEVKRSRD